MKPVSAVLFAAALVAAVLVCHAATLAANADADCLDNCKSCTGEGNAKVCTECKEGYGLTAEKKCEACKVANCAKCDGDVAKCSNCSEEYHLTKGTGAAGDKCDKCNVVGCASCTENVSDCTKCKVNLTLSTDKTKCEGSDAAPHAALLSLVGAVLTVGGMALALGA